MLLDHVLVMEELSTLTKVETGDLENIPMILDYTNHVGFLTPLYPCTEQ